MSTVITDGSLIPLTVQMHNGATDKSVKANVYRMDTNSGQTLNAAEITLTHVADGLYQDDSHTMTTVSPVTAVYRIFEADASTPSLDTEIRVQEIFQVPAASDLTGASIAASVWSATLTDYAVSGSFGEHVQALSTGSFNLTGASIAASVWGATSADYNVASTFGEHLQDLSNTASTPLTGASIASSVWGAATSSYTSNGTFGIKVQERPSDVIGFVDESTTVIGIVDESTTAIGIVDC